MKRVVLSLVLFASVIAVSAQPRAIGGRFGGDVEFSYQHQLGKNMLDMTAGLGWGHHSAVYATVIYDWVFPIGSWKHAGAWNWYIGPGAGVGVIFPKKDHDDGMRVGINVGGQVGIEYQFSFPLNLSLDWRPMVNLLGFSHDHYFNYYGGALGIRYRF